MAELRKAEHAASDQRAALRARAQALAEAVTSGADASEVLLAGPGTFSGVLGPLAQLLTVRDGAQEAIAAALGAAAGAVVVAGLDSAVDILTTLRNRDSGRAGLVIAAERQWPAACLARPRLPADLDRLAAEAGVGHVTHAMDLVSAPADLGGAVAELLGNVVVVEDLADGVRVLRADPRLRVVTSGGDLLGAHWARGGSAAEQSLLSLRAAAERGRVAGRRRRAAVPAGRAAARGGAGGRGAGPAGAGRGGGRTPAGGRGGGRDVGEARLAGGPGQGGQGRDGPADQRHRRRGEVAPAEPRPGRGGAGQARRAGGAGPGETGPGATRREQPDRPGSTAQEAAAAGAGGAAVRSRPTGSS